ncbi:hypothetical protein K7432_013120 [Basidiobolus ranarum]|uniref:Uncharacterized protein n=1 Tax=Basidiobolus ranarum TaxID=34480 RepID=A0ABR2WJS3_9FUNG
MRFQILGLLSFMAVSNSLAVNDPHLNDQYHEVLSLNSNVKRQNSDDGNDDDDATTSAQIFTSRLVPSQLLPPVKTSVLLSSPLPNQIPSNVNSPIAATSNLNVPLNPTPNLSTPGVQPINSSLPPVVQPTFQPSPQITPSSQVVNTNAVTFSSAPSLYTPIGNTLSSSENSYFNSPTPVYSSNVVYPTSVISANPSSDRSESILPLPESAVLRHP